MAPDYEFRRSEAMVADVPSKAIETPAILAELSEASALLAKASDEYHAARTRWAAAKERWEHLHGSAVKAQEAEAL